AVVQISPASARKWGLGRLSRERPPRATCGPAQVLGTGRGLATQKAQALVIQLNPRVEGPRSRCPLAANRPASAFVSTSPCLRRWLAAPTPWRSFFWSRHSLLAGDRRLLVSPRPSAVCGMIPPMSEPKYSVRIGNVYFLARIGLSLRWA